MTTVILYMINMKQNKILTIDQMM